MMLGLSTLFPIWGDDDDDEEAGPPICEPFVCLSDCRGVQACECSPKTGKPYVEWYYYAVETKLTERPKPNEYVFSIRKCLSCGAKVRIIQGSGARGGGVRPRC